MKSILLISTLCLTLLLMQTGYANRYCIVVADGECKLGIVGVAGACRAGNITRTADVYIRTPAEKEDAMKECQKSLHKD